jgi:hypothetical protein
LRLRRRHVRRPGLEWRRLHLGGGRARGHPIPSGLPGLSLRLACLLVGSLPLLPGLSPLIEHSLALPLGSLAFLRADGPPIVSLSTPPGGARFGLSRGWRPCRSLGRRGGWWGALAAISLLLRRLAAHLGRPLLLLQPLALQLRLLSLRSLAAPLLPGPVHALLALAPAALAAALGLLRCLLGGCLLSGCRGRGRGGGRSLGLGGLGNGGRRHGPTRGPSDGLPGLRSLPLLLVTLLAPEPE